MVWPWCGSLGSRRRRTDATKRAQRRKDCVRVAAGGRRQEGERGLPRDGVTAQAFYSWKRKYAGLGISDLRELRQLRKENRKLKTLVANLTLDKHIRTAYRTCCHRGLARPALRRRPAHSRASDSALGESAALSPFYQVCLHPERLKQRLKHAQLLARLEDDYRTISWHRLPLPLGA